MFNKSNYEKALQGASSTVFQPHSSEKAHRITKKLSSSTINMWKRSEASDLK